ncbi:competence/damage-inducible protein A [Lentiprolixibacter aurantiacus]|uniref:CinA-like protein n=1 Tax=Lentiprolixibacter aurantiacus TaxID=2993939 RepID=A0AAE3SP22_9FLAO|nr:competence/damage-inducible protein A [Lentiprolixibacter aurantiacus]MCX2720150.1 competence/damage-inducible protein A [Lentiprolixibacter aurantiacus]
MYAEIITIGDEILIGQIVDTNSAYIAQEFNKIGISVYQISSVQDHREHILQALEEACSRADLILITGGLGPTKDDITKHTLCEFLEDTLVLNQKVLAHIEYLFEKYISTPISEMNRQQALVPSRARILHNKYGTAPGMWMKKGKQILVSLPGVPFEMKNLMQAEVLPRIQREFHRPFILHRTIMTYGLGESAIAERIEDWENSLPDFIKLAYLPNLGKVRLRLTAKGDDKQSISEEVEKAIAELYGIIGDIIYGEEEEGSLESGIAKVMTEKGLTLATAESFTGGKIAQQLTSIPGASAYLKGSVVAYATEVKKDVLGIPEKLIKEHSVVSAEVAKTMAVNARQLFKSDYAVSTTGNAGPTKGDSDADIGTVYIAIATPDRVFAERFSMGNHRVRIVQKSVHKAFELLKKEILKI